MKWWLIVLAILGVALAVVTVLFGSAVGLESTLLRALVAAVFVLPVPTILLVRALRARKKTAPLAIRPDAEVVARVSARVKKLREVSAAQSAGKAALPWTLVVGPTGSGKTTLIKRARLELPFTTAEAGRPEAELEGYVSTAGTIVELRGGFATRERSSQAHANLRAALGALVGTPIGSVVLVLDLARLIARGEAEIDDQAADQRVLLEAIRDVLGVDPPVFIVFSRGDALDGFVLGHGTLSGEVRSGSLGVELGPRPGDEVGPALAGLVTSLRALARGTVVKLRPELRRARFELAEQLERTVPLLERAVVRLLEPSPLGDQARVRGLFLGSAHQEGQPVDLLDKLLAQRFGAHTAFPRPLDGREVRSFFLYGPMVDVALRPRAVPASQASDRTGRKRALFAWVIAGVAAAFLALGGAISFFQNRALIAEAEAKVGAASARSLEFVDEQQKHLRALLELGRLVERLDDQSRSGSPLFQRFLLDRGPEVRAETSRLFAERMRAMFERPVMGEVQAVFERPETAPRQAALYDLLTAYLMVAEHPDAIDPERAIPAFVEVWARTQGPELLADKERQELVRHYLRLAADGRVKWERLEPAALATVRAAIQQSSGELQRLVLDAASDVPRKKLSTFVKTTRSVMFDDDVEIESAFTRDGWRALRSRLDDGAPTLRPWVLGHPTPDAMRASLERDYHDAFVKGWVRFLGRLKYTGGCAGGTGPALKRLQDLTAGEPIFITLTKAARQEAGFPTEAEEAGGALAAKLPKGAAQKLAGEALEHTPTPAEKALAPWFRLVDGDRSPLTEYAEAVKTLASAMEKDAAEPGKHAEDRRRATDAAREISRRIVDTMESADLKRVWEPLLVGPIDCASSSAQKAGSAALQASFAASICGPFDDNLLGRYPFAQSDTDASVAAVEELFGSGGQVWAYYREFLKDKLQLVGERFEPRPGAGTDTSPEMAQFYTRAFTICRALFTCTAMSDTASGGSPKAHRSFVITSEAPSVLSGTTVRAKSVVLEVEKNRFTYTLGQPTPWTVEWPTDGARLFLEKDDRDGRFEFAATGPWALFRIMERAKASQPVGDGLARDVSFEASGFQLKLRVKVTEGRLNPLFDLRALRPMTCPAGAGP